MKRIENIRRIIKEQKITSQTSLQAYLQREGVRVAQSTLSRDLQRLKVGKFHDKLGGYYYFPSKEEEKSESKFLEDFSRGFISVDFSGNLGVIRTLAGHANTVAIAVENLISHGMLGTVAGDDTLLVILKEGVSQETIASQLETLLEKGKARA